MSAHPDIGGSLLTKGHWSLTAAAAVSGPHLAHIWPWLCVHLLDSCHIRGPNLSQILYLSHSSVLWKDKYAAGKLYFCCAPGGGGGYKLETFIKVTTAGTIWQPTKGLGNSMCTLFWLEFS